MSAILIASHLQKTWSAARFAGSGREPHSLASFSNQAPLHPAPALEDISFGVEAGEIFGLVGPSGSGKSTLLGMLSGQALPDSGFIEILGTNLNGAEAAVRQKVSTQICLVSQMTSSQVFNRLGAVENLLYSARLHGLNGSRLDAANLGQVARRLLCDLGLPESEFNRPLQEMSFNMLLKVALGRALISQPRLLLLDEITHGLDLEDRQNVLSVLETQRARYETTIIFATRSLRTAGQICDRIALLSKGRLAYMIAPEDRQCPVNTANRAEPTTSELIMEMTDLVLQPA